LTLPTFNFAYPVVDADGRPTKPFRDWMTAVTAQQNAAAALAASAVPSSRNIVAAGGLHVGGNLGADVGIVLYRAVAPVAALPTTGNAQGDFAYAVNGRKAGEGSGSGTGLPVWWSGTSWFAIDSGLVVAA